jgi:ABC-2 type transport system permease protein
VSINKEQLTMTAAFTLWHKHMTKLRVHSEEAFGMLLQPILWVVLFGAGMTSMLTPGMKGSSVSYIGFMVPGIVALSALSGGIGGGTVWLDERLRGIVKEYLVAPIPRLSILMGNALSTVTKSLMQAGVIFLVGLLMGAKIDLNPLGWIGGIVLVGAYGLGFTGIALAVASKAGSPGAYHMLIFMLNLPLLFLSNALYPLKSLPTAMEIGARLNPTSYVVDGLRQMVLKDGTALSGGAALPLGLCFLVVGVFAVLGMWLALRAFQSSVA